MKRYLFCLLVAFAAAQSGEAQISILFSGSVGQSNIVDSVGTAINGDKVSIGTFPSTFDPVANADNLAALEANWVNFDSTNTVNLLGIDGRFSRQSSSVNNSFFDGKHIYLWVTESSGNTVTEYGLFSSTSADWTFPVHNSVLPPNPINSNEVDEFLFGDGISSGSPGSETPGSLQTLPVPVPEPGMISLLGLAAVLAGLCRRRSP